MLNLGVTEMIGVFLLSLLSTVPDEYGPLVLWDDGVYLGERLAPNPDASLAKKEAKENDLAVCSRLFADCEAAQNEFDRQRAMEAHAAELAAIRARVAALKNVVVLAASVCLSEYDFESKSFRVSSFSFQQVRDSSVRSPNRKDSYSLNFYPSLTKDEWPAPLPSNIARLKMSPTEAEVLSHLGENSVRCFEARAEVLLPNPLKVKALETMPKVVVKKVLRARLIDSVTGATLASF